MASTLSLGPGVLAVGFLCAVETAMASSIDAGTGVCFTIADGGHPDRRQAANPSLRAKRSNPGAARSEAEALDCFVASLLAMTSGTHLHDEFGEAGELLFDDVARRLVGEHALLRVDLVLHHADEDFRPTEGDRVEKDQALTQVMFHARVAQRTLGRRLDRQRLGGERLVLHARAPVDRVLEHARHGIIV